MIFGERGPSQATKTITLAGGPGPVEQDLFLVTAPVEISSLSGVVETALAAGLTAAYFDVYDGTASVPLTLNTAVISSLPAGSWIGKQYEASDAMTVQSSSTAALVELSAGSDEMHPCIVVPKDGVSTYIRLCYMVDSAASGVIRVRLEYESHYPGGISRVQDTTARGPNILVDGDMEAAGVGAWTAGSSAVLTKETPALFNGSQKMRITYGGSSNPSARQDVMSPGSTYRVTGCAESDGTAVPRLYVVGLGDIWTGAAGAGLQFFDVTFASTHARLYLTHTLAVPGHADWDGLYLSLES